MQPSVHMCGQNEKQKPRTKEVNESHLYNFFFFFLELASVQKINGNRSPSTFQ